MSPRILFLLALFSQAAPPPKRPQLITKKGVVYARHDIAQLRTNFLKKKLKSGITQRILYTLSLHQGNRKRPFFGTMRFCKVTWDLWDERYILRCAERGKRIRRHVKQHKQLLDTLARLHMPLLKGSRLNRGSTYTLKIEIKLNPVSKKLLKKVRLWMRQSETSSVGSNYVVSFLSRFINKDIGGADLHIKLSSPPTPGKSLTK